MQRNMVTICYLLAGILSLCVIPSQGEGYESKTIAVIGNSPGTHLAAYNLYTQDSSANTVVIWDATSKLFSLSEWDDGSKLFKAKEGQIPQIPMQESHLQVFNTQSTGSDGSKLTPDEITEAVLSLPKEGDAIGHVSIIGPGLDEAYAKETLQAMKSKKLSTEVSVRDVIAIVDSTGKTIYGRLKPDGELNWRVPEGTPLEVIVKYEGDNILTEKIRVTSGEEYSKPEGVGDKTGKRVDRELRKNQLERAKRINDYELQMKEGSSAESFSVEDIFNMITEATKKVFDDVTVPSDWKSRGEDKIVRFKDGSVEKVRVRKIANYQELTTEIKYWGERGFQYPSKKGKTTNIDGETLENRFEYFRFGDWVLQLKVESATKSPFSLNPFYIRLEGVVQGEDPSVPDIRKNEDIVIPDIPSANYPNVQPKTDELFFPEAIEWMTGRDVPIRRDALEASAHNAEVASAMFLCEPIRESRTHVTNRVDVDRYNHGDMERFKFFRDHAMARGGTGSAQDSGLRPNLWKQKGIGTETQRSLIKARLSRNAAEWLGGSVSGEISGSVVARKGVKRSREEQDQPSAKRQRLQNYAEESLKDLLSLPPDEQSTQYKPDNVGPCAKRAVGACTVSDELPDVPWDARPVDIPEVETTQTEIDDFVQTEDLSLPHTLSMAFQADQIHIKMKIEQAIKAREESTGKTYFVDEDSVSVEKGRLTFDVFDIHNPTETESIEEPFDESRLTSKEILDKVHEKTQKIHEEGITSQVGRGLAIYGTIFGLQGTIDAFEMGDATGGAINLAMTLNGIGDLVGANAAIYKATTKALGRVARTALNEIGAVTERVFGEEAARSLVSGGERLASVGGSLGELAESVPIVGTAFGVYSIVEDLEEGTPIGYADAGLDILITGLGLLGPEAEPLVIGLTIVRMTIDEFYNNIKMELDSLPSNANTGDKIIAVLKGIADALGTIADTLTGGIFTVGKKSHDLDHEYHKNQAFLRQLADYTNYFKVTSGTNGSTAINFAGGSESWNGGNIVFVLHDDGTAHLTMTTTNTDGHEVTHEEDLTLDPSTTDIIMGIGETHTVTFRKVSVKIFWFIPVHSKNIISGLNEDRSTLHGTYTGNNKNNNFFSVQDLPPSDEIMYTLGDYHYHLRGGDGDDRFYLGPQHSLVEGNEGSDVYFINFTSTCTTLNNLAMDKKNDFVILQHNYPDLSLSRSGSDVVITVPAEGSTPTPTMIILQNWFTSSAYQHMTIRTEDGVLFRVTVDGNGEALPMPFTLTASGSTEGKTLDASQPIFATVQVLLGSDHDDVLTGNDISNTLIGGKGNDVLTGGLGQDLYDVREDMGTDTIINFATDRIQDTVLIGGTFTDVIASKHDQDLMLTFGSLNIVLQQWFSGEDYQHCVFFTEDDIVFEVITTGDNYTLTLILLELTAPSTVDLTSSPVLQRVPSVIGSSGADSITANAKDNYITGGMGDDYVTGGEGKDIYVMKANDGADQINNIALDKQNDLLLFGTTYDDVTVAVTTDNGSIEIGSTKNMKAIVQNWFAKDIYQHLAVRTLDGITFTLPNSTVGMKVPIAIDKSKSDQPQTLDLTDVEWNRVQRVIGSPQYDVVTGNSLSNYIDPKAGGALLKGNNGSDTYVINTGYGSVEIDNDADDGVMDSLLFHFPLHTMKVMKSNTSLILATTETSNHTTITLFDYIVDNRSRHLMVTSSDGFLFILPPSTDFQPLVILINKVDDSTGQFINLTAQEAYSSVQTVYGAKRHMNHIYGNYLNNTLVGGDGDDCIDGGNGDDVIKGGDGADRIFGGEGDDVLVGENGDDTLDGGPGNDVLSPGSGNNDIIGGEGDDTVLYFGDPFNSTGIVVDLNEGLCDHPSGIDDLDGVENVYGTPYNDIMISSGFDDNVLSGRSGDDMLIAYTGYDILIGGEGQDTYDLSQAEGTKVINNFANDQLMDSVHLMYADSEDLRYERSGDHLMIRKVSSVYRLPSPPFDACNNNYSSNVSASASLYPIDSEGNYINR